MNRPKIFLTRELPPESMAMLREHAELTWNEEDRVLGKDEIIAGIEGVDGLLCLLHDTIDDDILAANPNLKVVANFAVGYNNIDVDAATRREIPVTNTPGVLTDSTADMAFALMMAACRRVVEGDALVRAGRWKGWGPVQLLGHDVSGKSLGIVGFGRIGQAMVPRAKGFSMDVVYWNRTRLSPEQEQSLGVRYAALDELLTEADFVSVHVALNDQTTHLIGAKEFARMKPTATIVNTSRGPVIDEHALVEALQTKRVASAGLDVYEHEPELVAGLAELQNVVVAPHLGSATITTRTKMGNMAADNCLAACRGQRPPNLVNDSLF